MEPPKKFRAAEKRLWNQIVYSERPDLLATESNRQLLIVCVDLHSLNGILLQRYGRAIRDPGTTPHALALVGREMRSNSGQILAICKQLMLTPHAKTMVRAGDIAQIPPAYDLAADIKAAGIEL